MAVSHLSQAIEDRVRRAVKKHPEKSNARIAKGITGKRDGKTVNLVSASDVEAVRLQMSEEAGPEQSDSPGQGQSQGNAQTNLYNMGLNESQAEYTVDIVQQILDWVEEHAVHPETGEVMFWPTSLVRQQIKASQDQFRSALNSERLEPHIVKLKSEKHVCWYPESVMKVRQRQAQG